MIWLQAGALVGLLAIVVPILAHLVARRPSRRLLFPTLRFFDDTPYRLRARQVVRDWPVLLVRIAIVAAAATALARPVFLAPWRVAGVMQRDVRAIVVDASASMERRAAASTGSLLELARERAAGDATASFLATTLESDDVRDGISHAVRWLAAAPPGRQSITLYTDGQRGSLPFDLIAGVPPHVGLDLVVLDGAPGSRTPLPARLATGGGSPRATARAVTQGADGALVVETGEDVALDNCPTPVRVSVEGRPALADALRARALDDGVPCATSGSPEVRLVIGVRPGSAEPFASAPFTPAMLTLISRINAALPPIERTDVGWSRDDQALVVRASMDPLDDAAFRLVAAAFAAYEDPASAAEADPRPEDPTARAAWQRLPSVPPADVFRNGPDSDGRLLWAAVLVLLFVETWMRRARAAQHPGDGRGVHAA